MKGRLEHALIIESNIKNILNELPAEATDYYYNISVAKEPKTCEEYLRRVRAFLTYANRSYILEIREQDVARYMHFIKR